MIDIPKFDVLYHPDTRFVIYNRNSNRYCCNNNDYPNIEFSPKETYKHLAYSMDNIVSWMVVYEIVNGIPDTINPVYDYKLAVFPPSKPLTWLGVDMATSGEIEGSMHFDNQAISIYYNGAWRHMK